MFFTVVIPTHQRKERLTRLLTSLASQTYNKEDFEIKVIATDNDPAYTIELKNYSLPIDITTIPNDPYQGRSASAKRNYGAQLATSQWIAFIDDDCIADKNWLNQAYQMIQSHDIQFLEGAVHIPQPKRKTFTYKGIKRLSKPNGFQTCNMFYRRADFISLGGFDLNFPFYLEDTDLAWTFVDHEKKHQYAIAAIVSHPVPEPAPHKMLESAYRMEKIPYLYKKHPQLFKSSNMRALPRPYFILSTLDISAFVSILLNFQLGMTVLLLRQFATTLLLTKMYRGCKTSFKELLQMYYYLLICPLVSLFYLIRGNWQQGVWVFLK